MNLKSIFTAVLLLLVGLSAQTFAGSGDSKLNREQVIAEVTRLGGKVEFDETLPSKPIVKIDLHSTQITNSNLAFLVRGKQSLKRLRYLDLRLTKIGDPGVMNIRPLTSLETLNLFRTDLSDPGLSYLRNLKQLQTLLIGGTKVTDAGLVNLKSMKQLKKLSLFQTQITDAGIPHLVKLLALESLLITGTKITDGGTRDLLKALPRLRFTENT